MKTITLAAAALCVVVLTVSSVWADGPSAAGSPSVSKSASVANTALRVTPASNTKETQGSSAAAVWSRPVRSCPAPSRVADYAGYGWSWGPGSASRYNSSGWSF